MVYATHAIEALDGQLITNGVRVDPLVESKQVVSDVERERYLELLNHFFECTASPAIEKDGEVVVDFPLVPVTAATRPRRWRKASSTSAITSAPEARAAAPPPSAAPPTTACAWTTES